MMTRIWMGVATTLGLVSFGFPAAAQSFDCSKAKGAVELAICGSPSLGALDKDLAAAYSKSLAADPQKAPDLRQAQRQWAGQREKSCPSAGTDATKLAACLEPLYRTRIAELTGTAPANAAQFAKPATPAPAAANGAPAASAPAAAAPAAAAAAAPAAAPARPTAPGNAIIQPALAVPTAPPAPAQPGASRASLAGDRVPAKGRGEQMLTVERPGRFAIKVESATGTALQLVDMIDGPSQTVGDPGTKDGRLDLLLDVGRYKLRTMGAEAASGQAKLTVLGFHEREPAIVPVPGSLISGALADAEQRSFWIVVDADGRVELEAAGRSLTDLRLWRNGRDLSIVQPDIDVAEPKAGHPLTRLRLEAKVEPGTYLVTAYGGPAQPWADGATDQPFMIRFGASPILTAGWTDGKIGPFGRNRFRVPQDLRAYRLDLPEVARATLTVITGEDRESAEIVKNNREPFALVEVEGQSRNRIVEIEGAEGQPYRLHAMTPVVSRAIATPGPYRLGLQVAGGGGEELPPTFVMARSFAAKDRPGEILGGSAPKVGTGRAWRQKFNLRGASSLLVEVVDPMLVAIKTDGVAVQSALEPLLARTPPRIDGKQANQWNVEPGWYVLRLTPIKDATGILDLTIGAPTAQIEPAKPTPPAPFVPLGTRTVEKGETLTIYGNAGPGMLTAPSARALPLDLAAEPVMIAQAAGEALELSVVVPEGGRLDASEPGTGPLATELQLGAPQTVQKRRIRTGTLKIPGTDRVRSILLAWEVAPAIAAPALARVEQTTPLTAGTPVWFDMARDAKRSFALTVPDGGLYHVETLGRLSTSGSIGTAFLPELGSSEAGAGDNMLIQSYLRAGAYRVSVNVANSNGHLGLVATPARMVEAGALVPEGSVRAALPVGTGVIIPIEIAETGRYRLDLVGLDKRFQARLEDSEGWPLTRQGLVSTLTRELEAGRYRLVVLPRSVDARVVARLSGVRPAVAREGHGPHVLAFDSTQRHQWREPAGRDDPRVPDSWEFALAGAAEVGIDIGDGMAADLVRADGAAVAKIAYKSGFSGRLEAGRYRVEARSLGRNDRLDYTLSLRSTEIQPGLARTVTLPATVPFAIADERVVSLTTFGTVDVRAVLRDADGHVVGRYDDRTDDWNIAISRLLAPGAYTLELKQMQLPAGSSARSSSDEGEAATEAETEAEPEESDSAASADTPDDAKTADDARTADAATPDEQESDEDKPKTVELRLALPEARPDQPIAFTGAETLAGGGVKRLTLTAPAAGSLVVAEASAPAELVLALERREPNGAWRTIALDQGRSPLIAAPAEPSNPAPLRLSAWTVDGGAEPIRVAARQVSPAAQPVGAVTFTALDLEGMPQRAGVAQVNVPGSGLLSFEGEANALVAGSRPAEGLAALDGTIIAPQGDRLWLLQRGPAAAAALRPVVAASGSILPVRVPNAGKARLAMPLPSDNRVRVWRAESAFGQPGLDAGRGMGIADHSALALAGKPELAAWNAGASDGLPVRLTALDLTLASALAVDGQALRSLPPRSALPVTLPSGAKRLHLDLAPGMVAIADWRKESAVTVWTGNAAASRMIEGDWTEILVANLGNVEAPAALAAAPLQGPAIALKPGAMVKRFFGAAGSLSVAVAGGEGKRLRVIGGTARLVTADGRVTEGTDLAASGNGLAIIDHGPGALAAWVAGPSESPWPAATPRDATLPFGAALEGQAMALRLKPATPVLLHARTTAPVILQLGSAMPELFAAGAEYHRLVPAGEALLRIYPPQDGALTGSLQLTATPIRNIAEGLGDPVAVGAGETALFGFELARAARVGMGVRAEPDRISVRLLDERGTALGDGVALLKKLEPGRYLVEARVPAEGSTSLVRPALVGSVPGSSGPPAEIARKYLEMAGLVPADAR